MNHGISYEILPYGPLLQEWPVESESVHRSQQVHSGPRYLQFEYLIPRSHPIYGRIYLFHFAPEEGTFLSYSGIEGWNAALRRSELLLWIRLICSHFVLTEEWYRICVRCHGPPVQVDLCVKTSHLAGRRLIVSVRSLEI